MTLLTNKSLTLSNFIELTKFRLSIAVVISSLAGYFLAVESIHKATIILLIIGGYSMVGASNIFNQVLEKDLDKLMDRTKNRPLPNERIQSSSALFSGVVLTLIGIAALYFINIKTAFLASLSIFVYACLYTPLKQKTSLSVFVGAFPGAIPFMLGWVAATNEFGIEPGILFMIQFFWQFPHFWAIGWFLDEDYKRAGYKMLPSGKTDNSTAFQIVFYTLWTIISSIIPVFGFTGKLSLSYPATGILLVMGLFFLYFSLTLMKRKSKAAAKKLIFMSIFYITGLQIIYVIDKYLTL